MSDGRVVGIYVGAEPGRPMQRVAEVRAVAGRGLEGDRYFQPAEGGEPADEVTLIESEAVEAAVAESGIKIELEDTRRNIVTAGVRLGELVGQTLRLGKVEVEPLEPNPPCRHLQELAGKPLLKPLARRAGVRGRVVTGGVVHEGDPVIPAESSASRPVQPGH